jgi:hypothetical protein
VRPEPPRPATALFQPPDEAARARRREALSALPPLKLLRLIGADSQYWTTSVEEKLPMEALAPVPAAKLSALLSSAECDEWARAGLARVLVGEHRLRELPEAERPAVLLAIARHALAWGPAAARSAVLEAIGDRGPDEALAGLLEDVLAGRLVASAAWGAGLDSDDPELRPGVLLTLSRLEPQAAAPLLGTVEKRSKADEAALRLALVFSGRADQWRPAILESESPLVFHAALAWARQAKSAQVVADLRRFAARHPSTSSAAAASRAAEEIASQPRK